MKKTLIVIAALTVAGSAFAQAKNSPIGTSSLTLSGTIDTGLTVGRASGTGSASATALTSGNNQTSKLIFRGTEDLGGGVYAGFWLEGQIFTDNGTAGGGLSANNQAVAAAGAGMNFNRRSTVSLMGQRWGELRLGREVNTAVWNLADFDPFGNVGVGTILGLTAPLNGLGAGATYQIIPAGHGSGGPYIRASNMITYLTPPTLGGFYGQFGHFLGENLRNGAANQDDGSGDNLRLGYVSGQFHVALAYGRITFKATPTGTVPGSPSGDISNWNIGGGWSLDRVQLMATVGKDTRESVVPAEGRNWNVGAKVGVGAGELRVSYGNYRISAGSGPEPRARKLALGYVHNLSKRTVIYVTAAEVRNRDGARTAVGGATIGAGVTAARSTGYDLGIRHNF